MSSLIRGDAVSVLEHRAAGMAPRVFGARVLRGDHIGMQRPIPLEVPVAASAIADGDPDTANPLATPPDLAEIQEVARIQGYNAGYEEGRAAALIAVEQATAAQLNQLAEILKNVHENHSSFFRAAERQVVDLALQIAQKVVEREVENMPDLAVNVIRAALEEMDARTAVRVRVNPDDVEVLRRRWTQVVPSGVSPERIELQADDRVSTGGAVIESTHGQVDAQLETKLAQLGNALWTFVMDVSNSDEGTDIGDA